MFVSHGLLAQFGLRDESQVLGKTDQDRVAESLAAKYMAATKMRVGDRLCLYGHVDCGL